MIASDLAHYVTRFHAQLMTPAEAATFRHLAAVAKAAGGRSAVSTQEEARLATFLEATSERILRDNPGAVVLNRCPKCSALARTPTAKLCLKCGHEWREPHDSTRAAV